MNNNKPKQMNNSKKPKLHGISKRAIALGDNIYDTDITPQEPEQKCECKHHSGECSSIGCIICYSIYAPKEAPKDYSHQHCFEKKNPPCGQKIEHLKCCICEKINPKCEQEELKECGKVKKEKDLEIFMDFCNLYRDYFNRAEIEGMDMAIGHLAVIGRDYLKANLEEAKRETISSALKEIEGLKWDESDDWGGLRNYERQGRNEALEQVSNYLKNIKT